MKGESYGVLQGVGSRGCGVNKEMGAQEVYSVEWRSSSRGIFDTFLGITEL